jgi:hypothetical protein
MSDIENLCNYNVCNYVTLTMQMLLRSVRLVSRGSLVPTCHRM